MSLENLKAAEDYDSLKKQFYSLKALAVSKEREVSYLNKQIQEHDKELISARKEEIESLRQVNEALTNALLRLEDDQSFGMSSGLVLG